MTLEELLSRLENVRRITGGYQACCPAHDDGHASLSLRESGDRILVKCHAGCATSDVVERLGLTMADLFFSAAKPKKKWKREPDGRNVYYKYCGADGQLLFQSVRIPQKLVDPETGEVKGRSKDFRQRRPVQARWIWTLAEGWYRFVDDDGRDMRNAERGGQDREKRPAGEGWMWLDAVQPVLYRLPQVLDEAANGGVVWISEGEKDAEALVKHGVCGTSCPMGAGKWRPQYSESLEGCSEVVIWLDNDLPGIKHALEVSACLDRHDIRHRFVRSLEGKDAADHFDAGHAIEDAVPVQPAELAGADWVTGEGEDAWSISAFEWTEVGNAKRFVSLYGDHLRWCQKAESWYEWTGRKMDPGAYWKRDEEGIVSVAAQALYIQMIDRMRQKTEVLETQVKDAEECEDKAKAKELAGTLQSYRRYLAVSEKTSSLEATLRAVRRMKPLPIRFEDMDQDPYIIACENGYVDLRNGELVKPDPELYITQRFSAKWNPGAECPNWMDFLERQTEGDTEIQLALCTALGYTMSGFRRERCAFVVYGGGGTGKSTILNIAGHIFGEYSGALGPDKLMVRRNEDVPSHFATLIGKRMIQVPELDALGLVDTALLKRLTGGDAIQTRRMRQDDITVRFTGAMWLTANELPKVPSQEDAFWGRLKLIPWNRSVPKEEVDYYLEDKLKDERDGIFNWMIGGARLYFEEGLVVSQKGQQILSEYREDEDYVGRWLAEECEEVDDRTLWTPRSELLANWVTWKNKTRCPVNEKTWAADLERKGIMRERRNRGVTFRLELKNRPV